MMNLGIWNFFLLSVMCNAVKCKEEYGAVGYSENQCTATNNFQRSRKVKFLTDPV